jgi:hypothetical protein
MKHLIICLSLLIPAFGEAQELNIRGSKSGILSFGGRSTFSLFNDGNWLNAGNGAGGQFRIQASDQVNTEWFLDYITGNVGDFARREDLHIGWSVMLYPVKVEETQKLFQPYFVAGHCFDYTNIKENFNALNYAERWSSAVQAGAGTHLNLSERFDISLAAQYMIHLGNDVHASKQENKVIISEEKGVNLEGHVLVNLSINYKIADLWKK